MTELYPSDSELAALSGTADSQQEVLYVATGESPYYVSFYKMLYRLLDVCRRAGDLRVYKDGDLTFAVRAGKFMDGSTARDYAGAAAQALTPSSTNYVYLTAGGVLTVNTTGFPDPAGTPHIPLAAIVAGATSYALPDIADYRGRGFLKVPDGVSPGNLQDLLPSLSVTAGAEAGDTRRITVQAKDAGANNLAARFRVRLWIATADYGAPSAAGNAFSLVTGTQLRELTAQADYEVISTAAGLVEFDLTIAGAATRYVLAEVDGRIYSSGALVWAA